MRFLDPGRCGGESMTTRRPKASRFAFRSGLVVLLCAAGAATFVVSCQGDENPTTPRFPDIAPALPPHRMFPAQNLRVADTGKTHITWTWEHNTAHAYDVWRWLDGDVPNDDGISHKGSQAFYRWGELAPGTTAFLRVRAMRPMIPTSVWSDAVKGVTDDE